MRQHTTDPTAALLIIGAEVLSGKVDDANGPFLIRALRQCGVEVQQMRVVGDSVAGIGQAVADLRGQHTYVFTTGGIGPTHDDVTMAGIAHAFGRTIQKDLKLLALMQARHPGPLSQPRQKMAEVPQGATLLLGDGSFMPIVCVENVYVLPGVPALMRSCFAEIAPTLQSRPFFSHALLLDVAESDIADVLSAAQAEFSDLTVGSYPRFDKADHRVKVTIDGRAHGRVQACLADLRAKLPAGAVVAEL